MVNGLAGIFDNLEADQAERIRQVAGLSGAAVLFALRAAVIIALDDIVAVRSVAGLAVDEIAEEDIYAPAPLTFDSGVLTQAALDRAIEEVGVVYGETNLTVAFDQSRLAEDIVEYVDNVRQDPYSTPEEKVEDLNQITALQVDDNLLGTLVTLDAETWRLVSARIRDLLEETLENSIRDVDLAGIISQLPNRAGVRFEPVERDIIVAFVEDLVRPNRFPDDDLTEGAIRDLRENFQPIERSFERGQVVIREGVRISAADHEALEQLGLLEVGGSDRFRVQLRAFGQALMMSTMVMIIAGLFVVRFTPDLFEHGQFLGLSGAILLVVLLGAQVIGPVQTLYLYPTGALALLLVAIIGLEVAVVASMVLAVLLGFMLNQSLEYATLTLVGGMIGALTLRRAERLNSFFFAGLMISLSNILVIVVYNLDLSVGDSLVQRIVFGGINGLFAAGAALGGMWIVTLLFNLPTGLRLVELSQPNQPLLQRLLREAPGTYQHSLQVANLAEQATNAVGGNAELTRVAALYHDVGKMLNAPFFVENQADGVNPHDGMNDPYRSADIIISHVTEGEKLARQHRLPARIRDFILEHHGTTRVEYFYRLAVAQAEENEEVDAEDFTYPGPVPQSKETAIMMLADSCESTVRARRPSNKQEIADIVQQIVDSRLRDGQLDESGLTSNDMRTIRNVFVEMLQAVFHPRINYPAATAKRTTTPPPANTPPAPETPKPPPTDKRNTTESPVVQRAGNNNGGTVENPIVELEDDDEDSPMPEVPPLPRSTAESRAAAESAEAEKPDTDEDDA